MNLGSTERLVFSVTMGFAVILNVIASSYLEFYPTTFLIGVAFAIGITMVIGTGYVLIRETDKPKKVKAPHTFKHAWPAAAGRADAAPS